MGRALQQPVIIESCTNQLSQAGAGISNHPPLSRQSRKVNRNWMKEEMKGGKKVCDIYSSPGMGTIISANQMRKAVLSKGFNPFKMGLTNTPAIMMVGEQAAYQHWRSMIVAQSTSDWNICAKCMAKLKPYLSEKSKMWWQFWK
ncbi:hypothetical protein ADN00_17975 [Ornatilinea apprima]|uniref:Uncharacterized protein n=1 Tax=Ornatilinea apprima TaxID=1134406 RepID=A0A0P6WLV0_9CHLR|nr:hypothetical protein [Ornatilinea apprima]KPL70765.1 hypothetical protein ADN00_17975 [Ornatilinea apprima]